MEEIVRTPAESEGEGENSDLREKKAKEGVQEGIEEVQQRIDLQMIVPKLTQEIKMTAISLREERETKSSSKSREIGWRRIDQENDLSNVPMDLVDILSCNGEDQSPLTDIFGLVCLQGKIERGKGDRKWKRVKSKKGVLSRKVDKAKLQVGSSGVKRA